MLKMTLFSIGGTPKGFYYLSLLEIAIFDSNIHHLFVGYPSYPVTTARSEAIGVRLGEVFLALENSLKKVVQMLKVEEVQTTLRSGSPLKSKRARSQDEVEKSSTYAGHAFFKQSFPFPFGIQIYNLYLKNPSLNIRKITGVLSAQDESGV